MNLWKDIPGEKMTINKYIRFTNDFYVIFPHDRLYPSHEQMAEGLKMYAGMQVQSAGQIIIDNDEIVCSGESSTLGIQSMPAEDEAFFRKNIFQTPDLPPSLQGEKK